MLIVSEATAALVGTDSGPVLDRMSAGTVEAPYASRWQANQGLGQGEPAIHHRGSWDAERCTLACSRVGWSCQPRDRQGIGSDSLRCCMARCRQVTSGAKAEGCGNGGHGASTTGGAK